MAAAAQLQLDSGADGPILRLAGALGRAEVRALNLAIQQANPREGRKLVLDLSGVAAMDGSIVATLVAAWRRAKHEGGTIALGPVSQAAERALSVFRVGAEQKAPPPPPNVLEALGGTTLGVREAFWDFLQMAADASFAVGAALIRKAPLRMKAVIEQSIDIGSRALGIVGLITFLVGLTVAFQSAYQLQQFGAAIYVANLTGVSMVREMAPLMCAILVAGRSGSSIAAEIATMKVQEELDALKVMGMDPLRYLAVPRMLAMTLMIPLLTALADVLGILGGFLVGVFYLDIAPVAFINQMLSSMVPWDFISGLIKSVAFAWGIGLIGLYYGFKVRGGASEVGRTTTASVVASIFYIIVADCLFSVLFYIVL